MKPNPMPQRTIGDHGIIGDLKTAALVALDGTVDFMCWPSLDCPTVFAALLDPEKGGEFSLSPQLGNARTIQMDLSRNRKGAKHGLNALGAGVFNAPRSATVYARSSAQRIGVHLAADHLDLYTT